MNNDSTYLKSLFQINPEITFLNHGSYGACPKPVFEDYQKWQIKLERDPVKFLTNDVYEQLEISRNELSKYINCDKNDITYFPNPTHAVASIIDNIKINPEDEILTTNLEYGSCDRMWFYHGKQNNYKYVRSPITLPIVDDNAFLQNFWQHANKNTKYVFISHITSGTGMILPIEKIMNEAKKRGIKTIIDGAHVPGHINLDIKKLDPDYYVGACHKWMCSPKGTAFLYVNKNMQNIIEPLVISWGYESDKPGTSQFLDYLEWQGTNDMSSYLTIPDTIKFLEKNNWKNVAEKCRKLNIWARNEISQLLKIDPISDDKFLGQMSSIPIQSNDILKDQIDFYINYKIQLPFIKWHDKEFFRISIQAYNTKEDIFRLLEALDDKYN